MREGPDRDPAGESPLGRTADLLARIAAILDVDPAYFLQDRAAPDACGGGTDDLAELLRLFRAIEDPDTRRAALDLIRLLRKRGEDS